ncbi:ABC transporter substrate-binding protein [Microlunatus speluncae]|uniref:ABC transporter substrate-binding protein n=1 Tax=Microlunatus speluncae TaxID=2594267 RepID=UPI00126662EE|nr:ABC transporter substrate-binding protein [Microlunatus speluncae]
MTYDPTRRDLLRLGGGALVSAPLLAGCSLLSTDPANKPAPSAAGDQNGAKEAPALAEQVKAGKLPPLAERLPKNPMIAQPVQEVGAYGGTLRFGAAGEDPSAITHPARSGLVEWNLDCTAPQEGLAEKWEIVDDGRTYVFQLREGLKWSDGEPFGPDDLIFLYDHVYGNKTLTPAPTSWLAADGKQAEFAKIDDHRFSISYDKPNSLLLKYLCFAAIAIDLIKPAHYLKQFHPDFVELAKLKKLAKDEGYPSWNDLFVAKDSLWKNPERPVLGAWKLTKPTDTKNANATAERNPYFWKVDPDGRQLPYIDKLSWTFTEPENLILQTANGQYDLNMGVGIAATPILAEKAEEKGFEVRRWQSDGWFVVVNLNQSHTDPVIRSLFANLDVRAALSHAINRDEINEALLAGQGTTDQPCGQKEDEYFEEGMGKRFVEYDVAQANSLLDKAGLTARDGDGMRLRPDGKKLRLTLTCFEFLGGVNAIDVFEFVRRYWREVGIAMEIKVISPELWYASVGHGEMDIMGYVHVGYRWDIDPLWYVPALGLSYWAPRFGNWYANPNDEYAEEPTGDLRQLQILYDQLIAEVDDAKRIEHGRQILRLHDQNLWVIGTVRPPFEPVVVSKELINVPQLAVTSHRSGDVATTCQLFFRNPENH